MNVQSPGHAVPNRSKGFSLLELLVVIAVLTILITLVAPILGGSREDMTRAASVMSSILQQARTHAMSNNTYVYVGLLDSSSSPPELSIALVEATDGLASRTNNLVPDADASVPYQLVQPMTVLNGVRLDTTTADSNLTGDDPLVPTSVSSETLENSQISFPARIVTNRSDMSDAIFEWVVQYSPDGAARLDAEQPTAPNYIVLGLVPATGDPANAVGFQIDGPSGAVRVLRPGA